LGATSGTGMCASYVPVRRWCCWEAGADPRPVPSGLAPGGLFRGNREAVRCAETLVGKGVGDGWGDRSSAAGGHECDGRAANPPPVIRAPREPWVDAASTAKASSAQQISKTTTSYLWVGISEAMVPPPVGQRGTRLPGAGTCDPGGGRRWRPIRRSARPGASSRPLDEHPAGADRALRGFWRR
jgi:hypothetical protein